jgi:hypothetical protein
MAFRSKNDPFLTLGLPSTAGRAEIDAARRRLAKVAHPDAGGSDEAMQRVNDAADQAAALLAGESHRITKPTAEPKSERNRDENLRFVRTDHPSFTIEALPTEAFEGLMVVASGLGSIIDDEPPYVLEVALDQPIRCWCRLEVTPEGGSSSVSIAIAAESGQRIPAIDTVRDAWIDELNLLDWSLLDQLRPPS